MIFCTFVLIEYIPVLFLLLTFSNKSISYVSLIVLFLILKTLKTAKEWQNATQVPKTSPVSPKKTLTSQTLYLGCLIRPFASSRMRHGMARRVREDLAGWPRTQRALLSSKETLQDVWWPLFYLQTLSGVKSGSHHGGLSWNQRCGLFSDF